MDAELAFARALLADPHDAGLRLIYADWLEEQGRVVHAELVRESQGWGWEAHVYGYCATFSRRDSRGWWVYIVERREYRWPRRYPALIRRSEPHYDDIRVRPDGTSPDSAENWAWLVALALAHGLEIPDLSAAPP